MTCEVAVMNANGIALATDSAVTLSPQHGLQQKVYHNAQKLFRLSETEPVAAMTFGSAQLLGIPWETVIKTYRHKVGARRFDYLDQYAEDFRLHLESSNPLFPPDAQRDMVREHAGARWQGILKPVWEKFGDDTTVWLEDAWAFVTEKVDEERATWECHDDLPVIGSALGAEILPLYESAIAEVETTLFDGVKVPKKIRAGFRHIVRMMYQRDAFCSECESGIVIAGFGDQEAFPRVVSFTVDAIVAGRLRYRKGTEAQITRSNHASVVPFAQRDMVDMFYSGASPLYKEQMTDTLRSVLQEHVGGTPGAGHVDDKTEAIVLAFNERLEQEIEESYTERLVASVAGLPLSELCGLAEALVSLTVFRARMTVGEAETVGGDIDVAAISKGDGFVWVQRKELIARAEHADRPRVAH